MNILLLNSKQRNSVKLEVTAVSSAWHDNVKITSTTAECTTGHATGHAIYHYSVFGLLCCTVFKNTKLMTKIPWQTVRPLDKNNPVCGAHLTRYPPPLTSHTHTHSAPWGQVGAPRILIPDVVCGYKMGVQCSAIYVKGNGVSTYYETPYSGYVSNMANHRGVVHAKARDTVSSPWRITVF